MITPQGPGVPFQLLFDDESHQPHSLPEPFLSIYPADWRIAQPENRSYTYTNFGMSRDGRISYNESGQEEAYHVTKGDPHDRWLMALLRMRADTFMVGDTTLKLEKYHFETSGTVCPWSAQFIFPPDAEAFAAQRAADGLKPTPRLVVLSIDGNVDLTANCFTAEGRQIVLATTRPGAVKAQEIGLPANVDLHVLGDEVADLERLAQILYTDYGSRQMICEGGSRVFANMLNQGLVDEEFVTWCPTFVGRSHDHNRPSYTEGVAWMPDRAPYSKPVSLQRGGDCIFLRTRCDYSTMA